MFETPNLDRHSGAGKVESQRTVSDYYYEGLRKCVERYKSNKRSAAMMQPLADAYKAQKVNVHYFSKFWWVDFLQVATLSDKEGRKLQSNLMEEIEAINTSNIEIRDFLHFYALAIRVGLFNIAFLLREKAKRAAIEGLAENMHANFSKFAYGIGALHESGLFKEAEKYIIDSTVTNPKYLSKERHLRNSIGTTSINYDDLLPIESETDRAFADYIQGKTIAIVGPAKTETLDAEEIDSFDIVVRCNYKEKGVGVDSKIKGLKCNISFFNGPNMEKAMQSTAYNWPLDTRWVICKTEQRALDFSFFLNNRYPNYPFNSRHALRLDYILFNGRPNAVPIVVLDLLRFRPKKIKIFHSDLMLTIARNNGYETPNMKNMDKASHELREFTHHDPFTQFYILKNALQNAKIIADKRLSQVLMMKESEYISSLQTIFGSAGKLVV